MPSGGEGSRGSYVKGFATGSFDFARDDGEVRFVFSSVSIFASGKQFTTSSFVSQPLRAAPMPNHKSCKRAVRWASGLITHRTPFSFASGHQRQSRSSRFGAALRDRKSTRLNSSHSSISYAVFCLKKKKKKIFKHNIIIQ